MLEISVRPVLCTNKVHNLLRQSAGKSVILKIVISNLTKWQKDILIGLVLGDGNLEFNGCRGTRLQVKQEEKKQEYVIWLYNQFSTIVKTPPQQRRDTGQWYFGTRYYTELY